MNEQNENVAQKQGDTYSYKGWLNSDSFLKRVFGVYFHTLVAGIILSILMVGLYLLFAVMLGVALS